jgi:hypothetical protein
MENGILQKILIPFAVTALLAMGAGVVKHEATLSGISKDVSYIRENIADIKEMLKHK